MDETCSNHLIVDSVSSGSSQSSRQHSLEHEMERDGMEWTGLLMLCYFHFISCRNVGQLLTEGTCSSSSKFFPLSVDWGGRVVRWCWVNFQCRGILLIWIRVGQRLTAFAVGAGEGAGCLDFFFSRLSFLFSFSLSLGDSPI